MSKRIIHIYGASGSGTSTLGRYISEKLGYLFMDVDDYFGEPTDLPYTVKRSFSKRLELMKKDIAISDNIVISGSLVDWGDELIPLFTTVIRLETDTEIRIERLRKREKELLGERIELGGDMYQNHHHQDFIEWAASYDNGGLDMRSKANHDEWQKLLRCKQILLDGSKSLEYSFNQIKSNKRLYLIPIKCSYQYFRRRNMNKITCICLGVRSMEKSIKFYRDGLGFKTDCTEDNPPVCFFNTPGTKFELYPLDLLAKDISEGNPPTGHGFGGITLAYNVEHKEDVDKVIELVKKAGGEIVKEPQNVFWGGYHAYFTDLDGYYWEVAWGPDFQYDENGLLKF